MIYISSKGEYPRHIGDIQLEHKGFKAGDPLPEGWVKVAEVDRPLVQTDELAYESFPVEVEGVMTQNWLVRGLTQEELEIRNAAKTAKEKAIALGLAPAQLDAPAEDAGP